MRKLFIQVFKIALHYTRQGRVSILMSLLVTITIVGCGNPSVAQSVQNTMSIAQVDSLFTYESPLNEDIHSLLVLNNDTLVFEKYYNGFHKDSVNNLKSITKSIVGLLIGIAIEEGYIGSIDDKVVSYFDECERTEEFNQKKDLTIRNFLLMQSGIKWNNSGEIKREWFFHDLPHCFLMSETEMDTIPGIKFSYNSAAAHVLSGIISRSSKMNTYDFAMKHLFAPLGITDVLWGTDSNGEFLGNSEIYLKPVDMLKLGQLMLNRGEYDGKRILSQQWVDEVHQTSYDATSFMNYGYLWMTSKNTNPYYYFAGGSGGHHIFVYPKKRKIVVTTGHWDNARSTIRIMNIATEYLVR